MPKHRTPVYLLLGPEIGEKHEFLRELSEKTVAKGGEVERFYAFDADVNDVIQRLRTGSLFGDHRLVILQAAEQIKSQADTGALLDYLANPSTDATLVLESDEVKINRKLQQAVGQDGIRIFWEMFDNQKPGWVLSYLRRHGRTIEPEAVEYMLEIVTNNTEELRRVCDAICLVTDADQTVTTDDIEAHIYHSKEESVFTLFDAIGSRNLEMSLEILHAIVLSDTANTVQLLGGILWQTRRLLSFRRLIDQRFRATEAASSLGIRGKRAQKSIQDAAERYTAADLEQVIRRIALCEEQLRSARPGWHTMLLEVFLYDVIVQSGRVAETLRREAGSYL